MANLGYHNSILLNHFREFYQELARLKTIVMNSADERQSPESDVDTEEIALRLETLLEAQAEQAFRGAGPLGFELYREAQYLMAALADEFFLEENPHGKWPSLEMRLFGSSSAGQSAFRKLDLLLLQRDPVYLDLAAVYFFALSLGFQGKFRGHDPRSELDNYKRRLFALIFRAQPELLQRTKPAFPQTYLHTLSEGKALRLPRPRRWWLGFACIVFAWLVVSHLLWRHVTGPVIEHLDQLCAVSACAGDSK
jgi:type VI secretion system protein ImpK